MKTSTERFTSKARSLGEISANAFFDEFGESPAEVGKEVVGDWDSSAWSVAWSRLQSNGANNDSYEECLESWKAGFWV